MLCLQAKREAEAREAAEDARVAAAIAEQERQAAAKEVAQREKRVKMQADVAAVRACMSAAWQRERRPGRPLLGPLVVHGMSCWRLHALWPAWPAVPPALQACLWDPRHGESCMGMQI